MQDMERRTICKVLRENGGNISESARVLQMSRQRLQYRHQIYRFYLSTIVILLSAVVSGQGSIGC